MSNVMKCPLPSPCLGHAHIYLPNRKTTTIDSRISWAFKLPIKKLERLGVVAGKFNPNYLHDVPNMHRSSSRRNCHFMSLACSPLDEQTNF